jgi:hypothetical protein
MSDQKISDLPASGVLSTATLFETEDAGVSKKATGLQLQALMGEDAGGVLTITRGGTGQTTAAAARNALLPAQGGHAGDVLTSDGANVSWAPGGGGGLTDVTSTGSSCTVTTVGMVRNVEINPAHHNALTAPLDVDFTPVANRYKVFLCSAGADWGFSVQNITTGGTVYLCAGGTEGQITGPGGAEQVLFCNGTNALTVSAGNAYFGGQVRIVGNFGAFGVAPVGQQASGGALVDATGGAVGGTLNAVAGTGDDAHINDNFASLSAKVETLRAGVAALGWFS